MCMCLRKKGRRPTEVPRAELLQKHKVLSLENQSTEQRRTNEEEYLTNIVIVHSNLDIMNFNIVNFAI